MSAVFDTPIRTNTRNLDRVLAVGRAKLLVFETPDCGPCRELDPILVALARDYVGRALIVRVENTDAAIAARFRLTRVPTLILWRESREIARIEGAANQASIQSHMEYLMGGGRPPDATGPSVPLPGQPQTATAGPATEPPERSSRPLVVTDATFPSLVLQASTPVLVDFWAPWCGPCRMVSPIVEEMGRQYSGRLIVAKVNTDENPLNAGRLGIQGIPTLILFKNGREVDRIVGAVPRPTIQSHIERVLGMS